MRTTGPQSRKTRLCRRCREGNVTAIVGDDGTEVTGEQAQRLWDNYTEAAAQHGWDRPPDLSPDGEGEPDDTSDASSASPGGTATAGGEDEDVAPEADEPGGKTDVGLSGIFEVPVGCREGDGVVTGRDPKNKGPDGNSGNAAYDWLVGKGRDAAGGRPPGGSGSGPASISPDPSTTDPPAAMSPSRTPRRWTRATRIHPATRLRA